MARPESPEIRTLGLNRLAYPRLAMGAGGSLSIFPAPTGFSATPSVAQVTGVGTVVVDLGTEILDTEGAFASNIFTVPSGLNGKYMSFFAGIQLNFTEKVFNIQIWRSTDGGSVWDELARTTQEDNAYSSQTLQTGPHLLATDDQYRLTAFVPDNASILAVDRSFFSGVVEG